MISSIYKSLVRSTNDIVEEIKSTTGHQAVQYWSWENRQDEDKLPKETLIGVDGFAFSENQGLWVIRYSIALSTFQDAHLLREMEMIDIVHSRTGEGQKINLLDPITGDVVSELVSSAWDMAPMAQSEIRNYRAISIELLRTGQS